MILLQTSYIVSIKIPNDFKDFKERKIFMVKMIIKIDCNI